MRYDNTFLKLWWLLPLFLQPRFIRIMYAKYWFDWFKCYSASIKHFDFERRYKYIKALVEWEEFLNIKRRNK